MQTRDRNVVTTHLRPFSPARRQTRGYWVLVYCDVCERWISEESRHPCIGDMSIETRLARALLRKEKQMEAGIRDYD